MPSRESRLNRFLLGAFFLVVIGYGLIKAESVFFGPVIHVPEEALVVHDSYILITGRAERISELRLNGTPIPVTEAGEFEEPYLLAEGSNRIILEARDGRERTAMEALTIVYEPKAEAAQSTGVMAP